MIDRPASSIEKDTVEIGIKSKQKPVIQLHKKQMIHFDEK